MVSAEFFMVSTIFHPKFTLLISLEVGKLLVGSTNLTDHGWLTAGETVITFELDQARPDPKNRKVSRCSTANANEAGERRINCLDVVTCFVVVS